MSGSQNAPEAAPEPHHKRMHDLFVDYGPSLLRFLSYRVGNESDASDLVQEAYLRLSRVKNQDLIEKPVAYLFQIAANLANEFHLRKRKSPVTVDYDALAAFGGDGDDDRFQRDMEARSGVQALERVLGKLPPLYREILLLRKLDGYSHAEIAAKLELSQHTVHRYLTRALARCREELSE
ncbi:MAG: RNA polymerase sigma factor [Pseudomonadota bacterium]